MMSSLTTIHTLLYIGAAQGFLLGIVLLTVPRRNLTANRLLAVLLLLFSTMMVLHVQAEISADPARDSGSLHHGEIWFLLFGPLFFLYARALTEESFRWTWKDFTHLLPFAFGLAASVSAGTLQRGDPAQRFWEVSLLAIMVCQAFVYLSLVLRLLRRHQKKVRDNYSSLERVSLRWLWFITIAFVVFWPVALVVELFKDNPHEWNAVLLLWAGFMYLMSYMSLRQPEVFQGLSTREPDGPTAEKRKYQKSRLSKEEAEVQYGKLQDLMVSGRPYLDCNLTLSSLSRRMGISVHHLSQIINQQGGRNFFEFVNAYRVEEARRLLEDSRSDHLTIAAVGFESGFSSVSSFNAVFRRACGSTPSRYRLAHRNTA
ncbi:MAG: helix-turn-helix transcriptional regulator [Bacteroidetes bacterium]|nr:helix-turn-helix transcriptional regulator [Bacteroidota bacterium]